MPTIQIEAQLTTNELLAAVQQLSPLELESFVAQVIALQAKQRAPRLSDEEASWLLQINRGLPNNVQERYAELSGKRDAEALTPAEYTELLQLSDTVEQIEAERTLALVELAQFRKLSLDALMKQLGIQPPTHV